MSTSQNTVDFILEQASAAGNVTAKKMFGEYGMFCDGKMVASICDDKLFIKPTQAAREFIGSQVTEAPPYPGAKNCFLISGEQWDDGEWLSELVKITARNLPETKKKKS